MTDRLATRLLRLARDPGTGRIRHRTAVEKALRAALFADLGLAGGVRSIGIGPSAEDTEPTGDRILDAVRTTVIARPDVNWLRWFRTVGVDRVALTDELVGTGRWLSLAGWPPAHRDIEPDAMLEAAQRIWAVLEGVIEPADADEGILAMLCIACGAPASHPRPRELRDAVPRLLDPVLPIGERGRETVQNAVMAAGLAIRRRRRILG
jgi:hypothetical protein